MTSNEKLNQEIKWLQARIHELESRTKKNSTNSHKPPSSDVDKPKKTKSLRTPSTRNTGGQEGHPGHTLQPVETPDHIVIHPVTDCMCDSSLQDVPVLHHEKRQVFDIPPLHIEVTKHEAEVKVCPACHTTCTVSFPAEAKRHAGYGPRIQSVIVYLMRHQLVPYKRTAEFFQDIFQHVISEGTFLNIQRAFADKLPAIQEAITNHLLTSPVIHTDETSLHVNEKNNGFIRLAPGMQPFISSIQSEEKKRWTR